MKIFTVHGSPDKNGNSRTLVDHVLQAAAKEGAETELVHIYDYTVTDIWAADFRAKLGRGENLIGQKVL